MGPLRVRSAAVVLTWLGLGWLAAGSALAGSGKVTICHVPPGKPQHAHTIDVNTSAVSAHLAHGDYLGACRPQVCSPGATASCYGGPAGTAGVGVCQEGTQTCNDDGSAYGPCVGEALPIAEVCGNALDDDCDGVADDGCVCAPGSLAACYGGPAGTEGVGVCSGGTTTCVADGSGYGPCVGEVGPSPEVCGNGLDDDCDGAVDETCVCSPGSVVACYDGPAGTAGVGVCSAGTATCAADGSGYGACVGDVTPSEDVCGNVVDEDCDGIADDGCVCTPGSATPCYEGPAGTADVGACSAGTKICDATGTGYGACVGSVTPTAEICVNLIDDDCDGSTDETCLCEPDSTAACYGHPPSTEDVGTCQSGTKTCSPDGTSYGACVGEVGPLPEVCGDGLDNDCDGAIDDGCVCAPLSTASCYGGPPGTAGVGACQEGTQTCNGTGTGYGACTGDVVPIAEVCGNGVDDDCDGNVDEGCVGDRAWQDLDLDGVQDAGEPGVAGVTFQLRNTTGALVQIAISDASGSYYFTNVPAGTYYVAAIPPALYTLTTQDAGSDDTVDSDFGGEGFETSPFAVSDSRLDIDCGFVGVP